ncbi:hypothetical protein BIW11_02995 [Tropilaelaps mercedesae]|uniref:Uncharacterized protein n=1 Tax=Tropilaelaps mercedesae TaxID=418985 RepID=A0A1V9XTT8_9ACAR|nr:hypothetical protein BIW11_02995 [Tropilaelaps mercedesae]
MWSPISRSSEAILTKGLVDAAGDDNDDGCTIVIVLIIYQTKMCASVTLGRFSRGQFILQFAEFAFDFPFCCLEEADIIKHFLPVRSARTGRRSQAGTTENHI